MKRPPGSWTAGAATICRALWWGWPRPSGHGGQRGALRPPDETLGSPSSPARLASFFLTQPFETLLHLFHLALEIGDLVATGAAGWLGGVVTLRAGWPAAAPAKGREHRKSALEHLHVPPRLLLERAERRAAKGLGHLLSEFFLLAGERFKRHLEIARHQHLHGVAIKADELTEQVDRQQVLPFLVLLLEDDLGKHRAGDVLAGLGVVDDEVLAGLHHRGEVLQRYIGAGAGVVEPAVSIFLDSDGFVLGHGAYACKWSAAAPN